MIPSRFESGVRSVVLALSLGAALVFVGATPASALDADGDGVADEFDQCPATVRLDLVNLFGCSVCPCSDPWPSHQAYVDCVTVEVGKRTLTKRQKTDIMNHATLSTCGSPLVTRCCTWRFSAASGSMGTCNLLDPARCDFTILKKWAENRGGGSCYYNPCTWMPTPGALVLSPPS